MMKDMVISLVTKPKPYLIGKEDMIMSWLEEKWIECGCQVSEPYDDGYEDIQRQHEAILALERTLDEILSK